MSIRVRGNQIQSYQPIIDARSDDRTRVIDGRNFEFDAMGPKAGFGNTILTPFPFSESIGIQGLNIRNRVYVITQDTILAWRVNSPYTWQVVYNFSLADSDPLYFPWFGFAMNEIVYLGQVSRGLYATHIEDDPEDLNFEYTTQVEIPGLPEGIRGAAVVRNRVILVTDGAVLWSATGDFSTLAPTPGGAGFHLISDFVTGEFLGISAFNEGFIVWTTGGGVLAEFIDGDLVWRWSVFQGQERPIGPWALQQMSNGMSVFLSNHGLKYTSNGQIPQDWTPEFNEFFRGYVNQGSKQVNARDWRMSYDLATEKIYLSESADSVSFWRTFAFYPTIDKWGVFSENIYGLLPLTTTQFGFVDRLGIPRVFSGGTAVEEMPGPEAGLNRTMPRIQKTILPVSSSAVSRVRKEKPKQIVFPGQELRFFAEEVIAAGWHTGFDFALQSYAQGGMDSWIDIGYVRPPELNESNDGSMEVHEVVVSTPDSSPANPLTYQIEGYEELWEWNAEDWDSTTVITYFDFTVDLMNFFGTYDLNSIAGPPIDYNVIQFPVQSWPDGVESEDWNTLDSPAEDWNGETLNLPPFQLRMEIRYSMDGRTTVTEVPALARFDRTAQWLTTMTSGNLHKIRLYAEAPWEYYHVSYLELTEEYGGQFV